MITPSLKIDTLLIANRSEIAARIQATAHQLGIKTVCIYTKEDAQSPHLAYANACYQLSGSGAQAYLDYKEITAIARAAGADALHPGYGFIAENSAAAHYIEEAGILWVGPSPSIIAELGDKSRARARALACNIPLVPGNTFCGLTEKEVASSFAATMQYPLLLKAACGGGGKGMRIVRHADEFSAAWDDVVRTSRRLFDSATLVVERYIENPRHIEVQIAGDGQRYIHLFERECSLQRNHQKVIEEAPAGNLSLQCKKELYAAALLLAQDVAYNSIGTVEFIVAPDDSFYFLEMNTRLQVEHTVTEMITGIDLVAMQLYIAEHHRLPYLQEEISYRGHAFECRIYAEQPEENFLPSTGTIKLHEPPHLPFTRIDHSLRNGSAVTSLFDAMLAKACAYGSTRSQALERMRATIARYSIVGLATNIPFLAFLLTHQFVTELAYHTQSMHNLVQAYLTSLSNQALSQELVHSAAQAHLLATNRSDNTQRKHTHWGTQRWTT